MIDYPIERQLEFVCLERDALAARVAALTEPGKPGAFLDGLFAWSVEHGRSPYSSEHALTYMRRYVEGLQARVAALTAAIEAYHAKFQIVATCTDGDVDRHIQDQMALHAVMLKLARTPLEGA